MRANHVLLALTFIFASCTPNGPGQAFLPNQPGGPASDVSGQRFREAWAAEHEEVDPNIRAAIIAGVLVPGMTVEQVQVVSNPRREAREGNAFWRRFGAVDEVRYRWFVGGVREPFDDLEGRRVCQLIVKDDIVREIRYCPGTDTESAQGKAPGD